MVLRSMTGYGRSEHETRNVGVEAEIRSVNGRHLSVRSRLSSDWMRLEPRVESLVRGAVARGAVDVVVRIRFASATATPEIDETVLAVYQRAFDKLGGGDASNLLRLPGVITLAEPSAPVRTVERAVQAALKAALAALVTSREQEGGRLTSVLSRELKALGRHLTVVRRRLPQALVRQQAALRRRIKTLLVGAPLDDHDPTLQRELAMIADRSDVTEEVDRLASHMDAFTRSLERGGTVGRELDFLLQEMGREVNTLGAKAVDSEVSERVVRMKGCVERLREQVANIE
jgi:uncharacterized protein (TIGR00255 family)